MNNKKKFVKHFFMLLILCFYGFLAAGSMEEKYEKGLIQYNKGNYKKAKALWLKNDFSYVSLFDDGKEVASAWYLAELLENDGNAELALKYKRIAYETIVNYESPASDIKKYYPGIYEKMMADPQWEKYAPKTYDSFDTYYKTTTHSIALGDVPSGTPVWFWGRVNPRSDGSIISIYDSESDFRLQDTYVRNDKDFSDAFKTQPEHKNMKIFGYVDDGKLYLLRVEHSGRSWTK